MNRSNLKEWARDKTCEELSKCCNINKCPIGDVCCYNNLERKYCSDVTPEDWQKALGEVPVDDSIPEDFFETATPPNKMHPYVHLRAILDEAYEQAAKGKGKERHAGGKTFLRQPIMEIGRMTGMAYQTGQAMKKLQEAHTLLRLPEKGSEAAVRELLGAIVYCAAAVLLIRENEEKKQNAD
jgi:hypothetical protein